MSRERLPSLIKLLLCLSVLPVLSCANPTASIKPDIEAFKTKYPSHMQTYSGKWRTMHYAWSGDPSLRPLIFIHGSPGSWEGWAHFLMDEGLQKRFHVIAIDRPGFGGSQNGLTEVSLAKQADDVVAALSINKSGLPAILVGHSFGGPVAAKMAMDYPDKVAGVVFAASSVSPDLEETKWIQIPATWWPIRVLIPGALRVCNEEILPLKSELTLMLGDWRKISAEVVLIQGAEDDLVPPGNHLFLQEHIRSELILKSTLVPGLNHFIPWKRPDLIFDGVNAIDQKLAPH